ncbi:hypothetical protein EDB84DRAFT_1518361 [Lactarius hengduanensis]|nr:hypothetical protein EDB84DRAFT_1518361 [Lactarius hengduanensis]
MSSASLSTSPSDVLCSPCRDKAYHYKLAQALSLDLASGATQPVALDAIAMALSDLIWDSTTTDNVHGAWLARDTHRRARRTSLSGCCSVEEIGFIVFEDVEGPGEGIISEIPQPIIRPPINRMANRFSRNKKAGNQTVPCRRATTLSALELGRPFDASSNPTGAIISRSSTPCPTSRRQTRLLLLPYSPDDGWKHRRRCALPQCRDAVLSIPKRDWDDVGDSGHERTGPHRVLLQACVSAQRVRHRLLY